MFCFMCRYHHPSGFLQLSVQWWEWSHPTREAGPVWRYEFPSVALLHQLLTQHIPDRYARRLRELNKLVSVSPGKMVELIKEKRFFLFGKGDKRRCKVVECLLYLCLGCSSGPAGRKLLRRDVQTSPSGRLPLRGTRCLERTDHRRGACHHTRVHYDIGNLL